jgi:arogenate dehydrogenase (NADP+)
MEIGIVGLGLIGGSLGLDLKALGFRVYGVSRKPETCRRAVELQIADQASPDLDLLKDTEAIFVCTPLAAIASTLEQLTPFLAPETIITDVGSVKQSIVTECSQLWANFVGGHPMAGSAEQGIEAAQKDLFRGSAYVLTPTANTPQQSLAKVREIALKLGSRIYLSSPEDHDQAVAWISHLPVMISAGLIDACMGEDNPDILSLAQKLASSGFRDTSRVGGGNPELGLMMAKYNREKILRSLQNYRLSLDKITKYIEEQRWKDLEQILKNTRDNKPKFLH